MKILIISNLFPPYFLGGCEILCSQVCQELERRGHQVVVLTSTHGLEAGTTKKDLSNVHRILKLYLPFDQPVRRMMRRRRWQIGKHNYDVAKKVISRESPDVIFIWSQLRLMSGAARAAQDSGLPMVYTFNDEYPAYYRPSRFGLAPRTFARYVADNWVFPSITLHGLTFQNSTCISQLLKDNLVSQGVPIFNSEVIYQGIPLEQFPAKSDMGKVERPSRVLYVGQLHQHKGVHTLIEAVNLIASRCGADDISTSIVGDGPEEYKRQLKEMAAQGSATVEFFGKVPHAKLAPIYREHDLFVFPSIWQEPFGLTHLEAMASGTPVISTADGGQGEFLKDGENALIFEKEDSEQLAQQIQRLIGEQDLSRYLAANARATVETEFTLERYIRDLESFLQKAA